MRFFLDTANLFEIKRWERFGVVDGVTTNPALLAREGGDPLVELTKIAAAVDGPVSAQVTQVEAAAMVRQGRTLAAIADNVVVKVPATMEGYRAASELAAHGIACNVTLTFQPPQAIPFARIPVAYVSLIVGRVEDFGYSNREEIQRARHIFDRLATPTRLLVASIRNGHQLTEAMLGGADVVTVPPSSWSAIYDNPLTTQGQEDFFRAWSSLSDDQRAGYETVGA
jgi:transaldolase